MHVYEYHTGGLFVSHDDLEDDYLRCDMCEDYDKWLGFTDTEQDMLSLIIQHGYNKNSDYIKDFMQGVFGTYEINS